MFSQGAITHFNECDASVGFDTQQVTTLNGSRPMARSFCFPSYCLDLNVQEVAQCVWKALEESNSEEENK